MVEGASLENWNTGNRIEGSNPSLSASIFRKQPNMRVSGACLPAETSFLKISP